ncbi:MAG: DUF4398 domain-containing protein, partial [Leptospiraceae bacterium]|nr:DUF4398 domain-containing protein [Leptospiraceae bacterium]
EVAKTIQTVNRASLIQMRLSENFEEWKEKMDAKMAQTDAEMAKRDAEMAKRDAEMAQSRNEFNEWKLHSEKEFENWKIQTKKEEKKRNYEMAQLSRRMSRLVEDFVIPSIPKILKKKFNMKIISIYSQIKRKHPVSDLTIEYDALVDTNRYFFLNSTKSQLRIGDIDDLESSFPVFREYFPEYQNRELCGILSTIKPEKNVSEYATKKGFIVMGVGDWLMKIKNPGVILKGY